MNNFEAKYIKISADYLEEKLTQLKSTQKPTTNKKQELSFKNIMSNFLGKPTKD